MRTWIIMSAVFIGHCVLLAADKPIGHVNGSVRVLVVVLLVVGGIADVVEFLFGKPST